MKTLELADDVYARLQELAERKHPFRMKEGREISGYLRFAVEVLEELSIEEQWEIRRRGGRRERWVRAPEMATHDAERLREAFQLYAHGAALRRRSPEERWQQATGQAS